MRNLARTAAVITVAAVATLAGGSANAVTLKLGSQPADTIKIGSAPSGATTVGSADRVTLNLG